MKKFNLTIPKPCHENWNQMTPGEKGRFCGACQKTVVDFTAMSDRELANYFKKPAGSVCGRFHNDQLNRELKVPKKPIPWLRHLVHIAWPAFILMLKSCNTKDRLNGNSSSSLALLDNRSTQKEYDVVMMGMPVMPLPEDAIPPPPPTVGFVEPVVIPDSDYVKGEVAAVVMVEPDTLMGAIAVVPIDTSVSVAVVPSITEVDSAYVEMDTVTVMAPATQTCSYITTGAVSIISPESVTGKQLSNSEMNTTKVSKPAVIAYPNPSPAGSVLNLKFADKAAAPVSIQVLTSSGQRVMHKLLDKNNYSMPMALQLPANLTGGVYFIQVLYANGSMDKASVVVSQ